jgi:hypothetical protein
MWRLSEEPKRCTSEGGSAGGICGEALSGIVFSVEERGVVCESINRRVPFQVDFWGMSKLEMLRTGSIIPQNGPVRCAARPMTLRTISRRDVDRLAGALP